MKFWNVVQHILLVCNNRGSNLSSVIYVLQKIIPVFRPFTELYTKLTYESVWICIHEGWWPSEIIVLVDVLAYLSTACELITVFQRGILQADMWAPNTHTNKQTNKQENPQTSDPFYDRNCGVEINICSLDNCFSNGLCTLEATSGNMPLIPYGIL